MPGAGRMLRLSEGLSYNNLNLHEEDSYESM